MKWRHGETTAEEEKFEAFVRKYQVNLLQYIRHFVFHPEDAEDVYQEILLDMSRKWDQVSEHENPGGWLFAAANICIAAWQRKYLREMEHRADISLYALADQVPALKEDRSLEELLPSGMTEEEWRILSEFYRDRRTIPELAERYGMSVSAVKKRLERSREHLRAELEKE